MGYKAPKCVWKTLNCERTKGKSVWKLPGLREETLFVTDCLLTPRPHDPRPNHLPMKNKARALHSSVKRQNVSSPEGVFSGPVNASPLLPPPFGKDERRRTRKGRLNMRKKYLRILGNAWSQKQIRQKHIYCNVMYALRVIKSPPPVWACNVWRRWVGTKYKQKFFWKRAKICKVCDRRRFYSIGILERDSHMQQAWKSL